MHALLQTRPEDSKPDLPARFSARESGAGSGLPLFLQTKLNVNQPGDTFEQEADHVARAATGQSHSCPTCGGSGHKCPTCEAAEHKVQLKRLPGAGAIGASPAINTSGGSPLSPTVRGRVEPLLGYDLGHVRVHNDTHAGEGAAALQAKAFTHQNHIWLGSHQSPDDVDLMAHESTHVVQQGAGRAPAQYVQRRETTNDGEAPKARLFAKIEDETGEKIAPAKPAQPASRKPGAPTGAPPAAAPASAPVAPAPSTAAPAAAPAAPTAKPPKPALSKEEQEAKSKIDPGEKASKRSESEGSAHPDIDRPAQTQPKAAAAALETKQQVDEPPKPIGGEAEAAGKKKEKGKDKGGKKGAAPAAPGDAAFAAADSVPQPDAAPPVTIPPPVMPSDSAGQPLPPNPASDAKVASIAAEAQVLRDEGLRLRQSAAEMRANAHALRGNMQMVSSGVGNAEAINTAFHDNSKYRHDAAGQADTGLGISDQKAATVAEQAPGGVDKANEEKAKSSDVASESSSLAGESASQDADDEDAAADAQENSGKMNSVSSDIGTIDNAVGQAASAATTLVQDAAQAKTTNAATHTKLAEVNDTLAQTDTKLEEMDGQNAAARSQLAAVASGPDQMLAQAQALDEQGMQLIETSKQIEANLAASQAGYDQAMKGIPKEEEPTETEGAGEGETEEGVGQPDAGGAAAQPEEQSKDIDVTEDLPDWLTGETKPSDEDRERAYQENEQRRQDEIKEIENSKEGGFDKLTAGDKMAMALKLTGRNLFGGISKISWPGWGKVGEGAAKMVIGLFDPRSALTGALGGVNMIVNASVQFFKQPSWGGLLKLAADVATGITIILGSIVALAGTIAAIMTAISILSFGTLAPICGPVIAFCATVMSTVGGWTFWAGMVALGLQALLFLKDLYAAATAKTAAELQKSSDAMSSDAKNAGNAALQAGMGKLAQFGGRAMQAEISAAGGGTNFARNVASKSLLGEAGEGFGKGGGIKGFGKALGKGITKRAVGAGKGLKQVVTHPIQTIKDIRKAIKSAPKEEPMSFKQGMSKDFLVGPSKEATIAANEAKVAGAAKVGEEVHAPPKAKAGVDEPKLAQSTKKQGPDLSSDEFGNELKSADKAPKQKVSEGNFKEKAELPNDHEMVSSGACDCRRSVKPICLLKSRSGGKISQAEIDDLVGKIASKTGQSPEDVERFLRLSNQMSGRQQGLASSLLEKAESGKLASITQDEIQDLDKMLDRLDKPKGIDKPVGSRKKALGDDPFTGTDLEPLSDAHKRQRWFEFRQREAARGKGFLAEGEAGYNEAYQTWLTKYERVQASGARGGRFERKALTEFGIPEKKITFNSPDGKVSFKPDSTLQHGSREMHSFGDNPKLGTKATEATEGEWGKPYHFVEVKDLKTMSDTGNLGAILDYMEHTNTDSTLELIIRHPLGERPFLMSGDLMERLAKFERERRLIMRPL